MDENAAKFVPFLKNRNYTSERIKRKKRKTVSNCHFDLLVSAENPSNLTTILRDIVRLQTLHFLSLSIKKAGKSGVWLWCPGLGKKGYWLAPSCWAGTPLAGGGGGVRKVLLPGRSQTMHWTRGSCTQRLLNPCPPVVGRGQEWGFSLPLLSIHHCKGCLFSVM